MTSTPLDWLIRKSGTMKPDAAPLSVRGDAAVESWRIVEPVLDAWRAGAVALEEYPAGSAGPSGWPV